MKVYLAINGGANHLTNCDTGGVKLVWERDANQLYFRKKIKGTFTFYNDDLYDCYTAINAMTECHKGIVSIYEDDSITLLFTGYFFRFDCTFNEDRCEVSLEPKPFDNYTAFIKNGDKEYNILYPDAVALEPLLQRQNVYIENDHTYITEEWTRAAVNCPTASFSFGNWMGFGDATTVDESICAGSGSMLADGWDMYYSTWTHVGVDVNDLTFDVVTYWIKEGLYVLRIGNEKSPTPNGWLESEYLSFTSVAGIPADLYARNMTGVSSAYYYVYNGAISTTQHISKLMATTYRLFTRCRSLMDAMDYMLFAVFGTNVFYSEFFSHPHNVFPDNCPVSNVDLSNLMILQNSDAKRATTSEAATKLTLTFNKLMGILNTMFQVYYHIDDFNRLHIEHISYYMNGLQYSGAKSVGIDLTVCDPDSVVATNKYTYDGERPLLEKFEYIAPLDIDVLGVPIDYSDCIEDGEIITRSAECNVQVNEEFIPDLPDDGFLILHTRPTTVDDDDLEQEGYYVCIKEVGQLTLSEKSNMHLSFANLIPVYWKDYGRPLAQGHINGTNETFLYPKKTKLQENISFSTTSFNPNELITTNLGDGEVKSAEYSFKNNAYTVKLLY